MTGHTENPAVATPPLWAGSVRLTKRIFYTGRAPYLLLLTFIVVIYTSPAVLVKSLAAFGPAQIIGGLGLLTLAFEKVRNREGIWVVWPNSHLLFGFLAVATLSCLTATWARLSFDTTVDLAKYCLIYLLIVNTATTLGRIRGILLTMVIGGLFPALGTLHNYVTGDIHEGERVHWVGHLRKLQRPGILHGPARADRNCAGGFDARLGAAILLGSDRAVRRHRLRYVLAGELRGSPGRSPARRHAPPCSLGAHPHPRAGGVQASSSRSYFWSRQEGFTNLSDFTFNQRLVTIRTGLAMFAAHPAARASGSVGRLRRSRNSLRRTWTSVRRW